jgi:hypothetical protein
VGGHIRITGGGKALIDRAMAPDVRDTYANWKNDPRFRKWMNDEQFRTYVTDEDRRRFGRR